MRNRKKAASARREQTRAHTEAGSSASRPAGEHAALRFLPERRLGVGGLCEVHAARDLLRLEYDDGFPQVAVKCLRAEFARTPAARRLLAREFFVVRHVSHPGVVRVHDLHEEKGRLYLSMELLSGRTLYDLQGQHPAGLGAAVIPLARQLFRSLSLLHGLGIAHGDIKPANLMLERDDRLVLFDFNTAEVLPQPGRAASPVCQSLRSRLGLTAYSLLHASPERLEGCPPSFADDVFAACCTVAELLDGVHPFARRPALEARNAGMPRPRLSIGNTPEGRMLLRGLDFCPARRPPAQELEDAFRPHNLAARCLATLRARLTTKEV